MTRLMMMSLAITALAVSACGGSTPDTTTATLPAGQTVVVVTSPAETNVEPGSSVRFGAQVTGTADTTVKWSVDEADGGTVDATGLYTAPGTEGTYHVRAEQLSQTATPGTSSASKKGGGTSVVHVAKGAGVSPVTVAVDPATATVPVGGSQTFAAAVTGTTTRTVTWTVQGSGCGSVSATGVYTAPNAGATCTVVATSAADATRSGTAIVTVTPAPVIAVSVTPATTSLLTGGTATLTATVTGTTVGQSTAVVWSVPAGSGTINASSGVYVAPATAGTYVVTATSVADASKKGTATVTVTATPAPVTIAISPTTATLDACLGRQFTATIGNSSNTSVTWSITEAGGGTVTTGAYVSPSTPGTYHVVAVSQADPSKAATATVTVGPEKVLSVSVTPGSGSLQANGTLAFSALVTTTCGTFAAQ